jgi:L-lactate dehydrogenase complex protein LldG
VTERELVLGRIRAALLDVPDGETDAWQISEAADDAAGYARSGPTDAGALVDLFAERCGEYRATVIRCADDAASIADAVRTACAAIGVASVIRPAGLAADWVPSEVATRLDDPPLPLDELDSGAAALTGCALAIALTGTIVLDGGPQSGRRALTLVPDVHICILRAEQIVYGVPEAVRAIGTTVRETGRPITLISGPSATSDIELKRVEGVHGPRTLTVVAAG